MQAVLRHWGVGLQSQPGRGNIAFAHRHSHVWLFSHHIHCSSFKPLHVHALPRSPIPHPRTCMYRHQAPPLVPSPRTCICCCRAPFSGPARAGVATMSPPQLQTLGRSAVSADPYPPLQDAYVAPKSLPSSLSPRTWAGVLCGHGGAGRQTCCCWLLYDLPLP